MNATPTSTATGNSWLNKIFDTGLGIATTLKQSDAAEDLRKAEQAATKRANAQASAANAQSSGMIRLALIGGGIFAVIVVLAMVFKRK